MERVQPNLKNKRHDFPCSSMKYEWAGKSPDECMYVQLCILPSAHGKAMHMQVAVVDALIPIGYY